MNINTKPILSKQPTPANNTSAVSPPVKRRKKGTATQEQTITQRSISSFPAEVIYTIFDHIYLNKDGDGCLTLIKNVRVTSRRFKKLVESFIDKILSNLNPNTIETLSPENICALYNYARRISNKYNHEAITNLVIQPFLFCNSWEGIELRQRRCAQLTEHFKQCNDNKQHCITSTIHEAEQYTLQFLCGHLDGYNQGQKDILLELREVTQLNDDLTLVPTLQEEDIPFTNACLSWSINPDNIALIFDTAQVKKFHSVLITESILCKIQQILKTNHPLSINFIIEGMLILSDEGVFDEANKEILNSTLVSLLEKITNTTEIVDHELLNDLITRISHNKVGLTETTIHMLLNADGGLCHTTQNSRYNRYLLLYFISQHLTFDESIVSHIILQMANPSFGLCDNEEAIQDLGWSIIHKTCKPNQLSSNQVNLLLKSALASTFGLDSSNPEIALTALSLIYQLSNTDLLKTHYNRLLIQNIAGKTTELFNHTNPEINLFALSLTVNLLPIPTILNTLANHIFTSLESNNFLLDSQDNDTKAFAVKILLALRDYNFFDTCPIQQSQSLLSALTSPGQGIYDLSNTQNFISTTSLLCHLINTLGTNNLQPNLIDTLITNLSSNLSQNETHNKCILKVLEFATNF